MTSQVSTPVPASAWAELDSAGSLPTQSPRWLEGLTSATSWQDRSRLYELPRGRRLIVPLVGRGRGAAQVLASMPYGLGYGGAVASDGHVTAADVALVAGDLARLGALRVSLTPSPFEDAWSAAAPYARGQVRYLSHALDLRGGAAAVWRGYSTNVRRSITRAERSGLDVRRDDSGALLAEFDRLYRLSVQRWARTAGRHPGLARLHQRFAEPPARLAEAARVLGPGLVVWAAFLDGAPVAAIVVLVGRSRAIYWRGAMDRDVAARTHANALLHHRAIEEAVMDGCRTYAFGESDEGSALAAYKLKFGARPVPWTAYHLERVPLTAAMTTARSAYGRLAGLPGAARRRTAPARRTPS